MEGKSIHVSMTTAMGIFSLTGHPESQVGIICPVILCNPPLSID